MAARLRREGLLDAVPLVGTVYGTTKKVLAGFGKPGSESAFKRFVLARLPGRTTPGFLTGAFTLSRPGEPDRLSVAVQLDGTAAQTPYEVWIDNMNLRTVP